MAASQHVGSDGGPGEAYPPPDLEAPQLTVRAVLTGMVLGAVLSTCNIYAGLKIGWAFNMSIAAALLSYGFWQNLARRGWAKPWGMLENNVNQAGASAGAAIAGAGLVAPIPALTMITGIELGWLSLSLWTLSVSVVGVFVAVGLRRQLLIEDRLPFPNGIATAETLREMYARGREAMARMKVLVAGGVIAAALKLFSKYAIKLPKVGVPGSMAVSSQSALGTAGVGSISLKNLGFAFDPSLLMVAFGAIVGIRAGASLMLGAVVAWGVLGPWALSLGWATPGAPDGFWYGPVLEWLLWPGVAMMVTASLTSFAFSWRSVLASFRSPRNKRAGANSVIDPTVVPRRWYVRGLWIALAFAVVMQGVLFGIPPWIAAFGVMLTFVLAIVAGRVSGETGITPIGAMGQVTQLTFGVVAPGNATANLMAANVTGGAATQCADMLHDLKTGLLIGASSRHQAISQLFGVLAGAFAGSAVYLLLVPDPSSMLLTEKWPAPAVAAWKAVAEVFVQGMQAMPQGAGTAMIIAGVIGIVLAALEARLPEDKAKWVPSAASIGLAFVIPAWNSMSMFIGAAAAVMLTRKVPSWSKRFLIVLAAGVVAGESLAGVGAAIAGLLSG